MVVVPAPDLLIVPLFSNVPAAPAPWEMPAEFVRSEVPVATAIAPLASVRFAVVPLNVTPVENDRVAVSSVAGPVMEVVPAVPLVITPGMMAPAGTPRIVPPDHTNGPSACAVDPAGPLMVSEPLERVRVPFTF